MVRFFAVAAGELVNAGGVCLGNAVRCLGGRGNMYTLVWYVCCLKVDLALEGRHLWQFNYNFRDTPGIRFPYPIYPLVAPEVRLCMVEHAFHHRPSC